MNLDCRSQGWWWRLCCHSKIFSKYLVTYESFYHDTNHSFLLASSAVFTGDSRASHSSGVRSMARARLQVHTTNGMHCTGLANKEKPLKLTELTQHTIYGLPELVSIIHDGRNHWNTVEYFINLQSHFINKLRINYARFAHGHMHETFENTWTTFIWNQALPLLIMSQHHSTNRDHVWRMLSFSIQGEPNIAKFRYKICICKWGNYKIQNILKP